MSITLVLSMFFASTLGCAAGVALLLPILHRKSLLDHPSTRSSHINATPHGGGWAVITTIVISAMALMTVQGGLITIFVIATSLALLSWWDDLRTLSVITRLPLHMLAAIAGLYALPGDGLLFGGFFPAYVDHAIVVLGWVWFINLYNFMDGIDGITGVETGAIGAGIALMAFLGFASIEIGTLGVIIAGASFGFLLFNWHPAKVFLGDVGSVPLGFLLGWLLLSLVLQGQWVAALILPLYYLCDATLTLFKRALRREKIWQAHKEHFYQLAHQAGLRHDVIVIHILFTNAVLIALALFAAAGKPVVALIGATIVVGLLLWRLATVQGDDPS